MYHQHTNKYVTQVGYVCIVRTYKDSGEFDDMFVTVDHKSIDIPKAWTKQTDRTIIRKVCAMYRETA